MPHFKWPCLCTGLNREQQEGGNSKILDERHAFLTLRPFYLFFRMRCPSLSRFVMRYFSLCGLGEISIATLSTISRPYPIKPTRFLGLFVISLILVTPRSRSI